MSTSSQHYYCVVLTSTGMIVWKSVVVDLQLPVCNRPSTNNTPPLIPTQMGLIASTYCGLFFRFVPDLYGTTTSNIFAQCFSFFNETVSIDVIRCSLRRSCVLSFLARKRMFVSSHIPCLLYVRCHKSYNAGRCNFFRYSSPL